MDVKERRYKLLLLYLIDSVGFGLCSCFERDFGVGKVEEGGGRRGILGR